MPSPTYVDLMVPCIHVKQIATSGQGWFGAFFNADRDRSVVNKNPS
jgi:hypothetical protein